MDAMIIQEVVSEIICIDGGSTDGSYELLLEQAKRDERIQVHTHANRNNKGVSASRNLGIQQAQGTWIAFCDIDDYYLAGRFASFAKVEKEGVDVFHTAVQSVYESSELKDSVQEMTAVTKDFDVPVEMQNYLISQSDHSISIIGTIIRKSALLKAGLFDSDLSIGEDTDLLWRLSRHAKFKYENLDPPRVIRQVHKGNTYQNKERLIKGRQTLYKKWRTSAAYDTLSPSAQKRIREAYRHYRYVDGFEYGKGLSQTIALLRYLWSRLLGV